MSVLFWCRIPWCGVFLRYLMQCLSSVKWCCVGWVACRAILEVANYWLVYLGVCCGLNFPFRKLMKVGNFLVVESLWDFLRWVRSFLLSLPQFLVGICGWIRYFIVLLSNRGIFVGGPRFLTVYLWVNICCNSYVISSDGAEIRKSSVVIPAVMLTFVVCFAKINGSASSAW